MNQEEAIAMVNQKMREQGTATYFDNFTLQMLIHNTYNFSKEAKDDFMDLLNHLKQVKEKRFRTWEERTSNSNIDLLTWAMSQGTHTPMKWKGLEIYKSVFDMGVYMQLLSAVKPKSIIEYGTGSGGGTNWMSDIMSSLDPECKIYTFDMDEINIPNENIIFWKMDLTKTLPDLTKINLFGPKIVIEDAHVNIEKVLLNADEILCAGDYLIVEDSQLKRNDIDKFLKKAKNKYMVDTFYTDFFGKNYQSAFNSIFKVI